jgi:hypothetical protein
MLTNTIESITLQNYMNTHDFHITFIQSTTPNNTQINHIWTNARTQQCHIESTQAYWTNHNPITLHSNYLTIFFNLLYHPLMNKLQTKNRSNLNKITKTSNSFNKILMISNTSII